MKQRLLTGTGYVLVLFGFFLLKVLLPYDVFSSTLTWGTVAFDALVLFACVVGTFEMTRALSDKLTRAQRWLAMIFAALFIPALDLFGLYLGFGEIAVAGVAFFAFAFVVLSLFVVRYEETGVESVGCTLLSGVYPVLMTGAISLCNHLEQGALALLFVFVVSPCADSIAYVFGVTMGKKFPKKMSPSISPKKTVVGGIGGIVGGVLGAVAIFFAYNAIFTHAFPWEKLLWYILVGAGASLATEFGDLIESAIKRKVGIKDMGNLMPGHGGVLDRIDGTMYCAVLVYLVFLFVAL